MRLSNHGRGCTPGERCGIRIIDRRGADALESNVRLASEAFSDTGGEAENPALDLVTDTRIVPARCSKHVYGIGNHVYGASAIDMTDRHDRPLYRINCARDDGL